jgi:hypothetical protein
MKWTGMFLVGYVVLMGGRSRCAMEIGNSCRYWDNMDFDRSRYCHWYWHYARCV